jgi:nucleoside 2-deoxyribosyltransferase
MLYKVFLSHSTADRNWVEWIAQNAAELGVEVYLYEHDSQPGVPIAEKIKQAIQSSDALVVLLTGDSQSSSYVHQEIGFAEAKGKTIIPLVQPGVDEQRLSMLVGREYIPFDFHKPQEALSTLMNHLQKLKAAKSSGQAVLLGLGGLILLALLASDKK